MKQIKKHSDLIILSIIWIVSINSVISVIANSYVIGVQNYIGFSLLIGISVLRFFKVKRFKTILGVLLIVGSINAVQYTYSTITVVFSWTPSGSSFSSFGIQPLSISQLLLLVGLNFSEFMRLINDSSSDDSKIDEDKQKRIVENHYNELIKEKDTTLKDIVENKNMYQIEYVKAAQKLIEERKKV